ncbi:MAG: Rpn family recombination-promoting nuclease/putative transposase [Lachnospiraceae bacterium]|nr:Rpn family recombination-promoting nuclease/putative transposase [Lachnospiraceae bacterium]
MTNISKHGLVPYQEQTYQKKKLEDLNLMDSFLFDVSTENPEHAKKIARAIVSRVIGHELEEIRVESQKQFLGLDLEKRGIRMDLWVRENIEGEEPIVRLYDIEPNIYHDHLPKRSRFYQAKADAKELPAGMKFENLPDLVMIWILPYDPFGDDRMLYTVKNMVVENNELVYNDGVLKLFLYTKGKIGGSEELKSLLTYFEETTQENAVDAELEEIQKIVGSIKRSHETEDLYMTLQEIIDHEKDYSFNDGVRVGVQRGIQQGIQQGIQSIIRTCQKLKQTKESTIETLVQECDITQEEAKEYIRLYWQEENEAN